MLRRMLQRLKRRILATASIAVGVSAIVFGTVWFAYPFPSERLGSLAVSPRVMDRTGRVLLQIVGKDDHWRFPVPLEEMSPWLLQATIAAEDERFYSHFGVDPIAVSRAVWQNLKAQKVVSGASTLTMQLCRMIDPQPRTLPAKLIESVRAVQAEVTLSKAEILEHYLNLAPYGGNVLGVEAAARRYFGRGCRDLSLGQAALLAGMPQAPSRYRPDRFPGAAEERQRYVLNRMVEAGMISPEQKELAESQPTRVNADAVKAAPSFASHAAWLALRQRPAGGITSIDAVLQESIEYEVARHSQTLPAGSDVAVVVIDISTAEIRALVGSSDPLDPVDGQNNGVIARRSPGSTLKPFLYAAAFEARRLNAESTVPDRPIVRGGWKPDNFDRSFRGAMTVAEALRQSRNIPAIRVAEAMGVSRCLGVLEACGVRVPADAAAQSGLAVAVGGVETTLLDLTNAYATLGRDGVFRPPVLFRDQPSLERQALSASTCRVLNEILSSRERTPRGFENVLADRRPWFMWKTGTSSGRRDAWAVGHNGQFAVGVWAGRFSGAGHSEFVGRQAAEPLLATVFSLPGIRIDKQPQPAPSIRVDRPLQFESPVSRGPVIVSPSNNAEFLALPEGIANVPVDVQEVAGTTWFLNQRALARTEHGMLQLARGHYELRCVSHDGLSDAVRFHVR
jgi:penicillin-binding protein 1C